jgi:ABC-type transport system substrate-binding protein/DNA-binding SARP family transcriptional activator
MARLFLFLLGGFEARLDEIPLSSFRTDKSRALLAYLAVEQAYPHRRQALAGLLWPGYLESSARANLRNALTNLRQVLADDQADIPFLLVEGETIQLNRAADTWVDVWEFEAAIRDQQSTTSSQQSPISNLKSAISLYRGAFLEGFSLPDSPEFDTWLSIEREALHRQALSALYQLAEGSEQQGQPEEAIRYAHRQLDLEPWLEEAHRQVMRLLAQRGQRASALAQYEACRKALAKELSVEPSAETVALYEKIRSDELLKDLPLKRGKTIESTFQNRYQLGPELGRGGMSVIYRAHDTLLDRDVAIKMLSVDALGEEGRARLLREAQMIAHFNHPHIVSVHDIGEVNGAPCVVMEWIGGGTLGDHRPANMSSVIAIAQQICAALEHAHAQGIIHRDLKPVNVMLTAEGSVKLTDFGLAHSVSAPQATQEMMIVGTVFYMAPEQALGKRIDGRADLYALGVMLYELVAGRLPFEADDPLAVISQHMHAPVVPPSTYNEQVEPALEALILRLLSKQPEDRPASAAEVRQALEEIITHPESVGAQGVAPQDASVGATHASPPYTSPLLDRLNRGRLVGREAEMREMTDLWKRTAGGESQVLLVSGEPGVGKTRLVRELVTLVRVVKGQALVGECYAEGSLPYAPFAQCLQDLDLSEFDRLFGLADLLTLAPALRLRYPDIPPNPPLEFKAEQQRLFESVFGLLTTLCAHSPMLIVLEDMHWADRGTLALFQHLARRATRQKLRLLFLLTYRETELDEEHALNEVLAELGRERLGRRLKLNRLDRDQTRDLLGVLFAEEITPEFLDGIYRETEGNPFFIEEVCKTLIEAGALTRKGGRWDKSPTFEMQIPQSIRLAVLARLHKLSQPAQETLRLAAILGREFEYSLLKEVSEQDEDALLEALEAAERAQLITQANHRSQHQAPARISFAFTHALIPSTLEESLSGLRCQRLHQRAARALEKLYPDRLDEFSTHLARHCLEAGEWDKAADYLLKAGNRARQQFAYQEAARHYQQALTLLQEQGPGSLDRTASTAMKLGLLHHTLGEHALSRQFFQQAFALWQRLSEIPPAPLPPAPHPLRLYWLNEVHQLDPSDFINTNGWEYFIMGYLFSSLVVFTPPPIMELVPGIAHSWDILDGGRRYIFHLRNDFSWSDGVPVTASDFELTIRHHLNHAPLFCTRWYIIKGARAYHQGEVTDPDSVGVHALDDTTLSIELEEPLGYFLYLMDFSPLPRHVVEAYGTESIWPEHLVTCGPFRLAAWEPHQRILLERDPAFLGRFSGNLQQVELTLVDREELNNLVPYEQDRLDVVVLDSLQDLQSIRRRYPDEFVDANVAGLDFYFFKHFAPPFNDRRVRQAFVHAVDRQVLANLVCHGNVTPFTGGVYPPVLSWHIPGIALAYDPERARRLLAEAGYPGGKGFPKIEVWTDSRFKAVSEFIQSQWRDNLGVSTSYINVDLQTRISLDWEHGQGFPDISYTNDYSDNPDPFLGVIVLPAPETSFYGGVDEIIQAGKRSLDPLDRLRYIQAVDRKVTEEAYILHFYYPRVQLLVKPWVKAYPFTGWGWGYWNYVILEPHS